jgi:tripartite-type tricarboxylate transporter receptor subunit TctC
MRHESNLPFAAALLPASLRSHPPRASELPDKPITMIVPSTGRGRRHVARPVAEALARELKQPVGLRTGPVPRRSASASSRRPADGYTVLLSLSSISILPEADKLLERKPAYS